MVAMRKVLPFKKPPIVRCTVCRTIKPRHSEGFSHRGIDYRGGTKAKYWMVFPSGWKMTEVIPIKADKAQCKKKRECYYQCPDCRTLAE
jgi:hypothetical protein